MYLINNKKILYAPNVHTGGGLTLLKALLSEFPEHTKLYAILDYRCKGEVKKLNIKTLQVEYWVYPNFFSRLQAEIILFKLAKKYSDVLCFHNIPPILCRSKNITIYFQNRLIIEDLGNLKNIKTIKTLKLERWIIKKFYRQHMQYITQTYSTSLALKNWFYDNLHISLEPKVFPFISKDFHLNNPKNEIKKWDFIYISSGEAHKNIPRLLEAWRLLDGEGLRPSLAITISNDYPALIGSLKNQFADLNIFNLGNLSHEAAILALAESRAFIHPSLSESFGLTLIEAANCGLPILAPELDYVRDICIPIETFDPYSATSIARAVRRFLGQATPPTKPNSANEFWKYLFNAS